MQRPKLLVLFLGSSPPKLSVSTTINHFVHFWLINVETDSLLSFVSYHYPFLIIQIFASTAPSGTHLSSTYEATAATATSISAKNLRRVKGILIHLHGLNNFQWSSTFTSSSDASSDSDAKTVTSRSSATKQRRLGCKWRRIPYVGQWSDPNIAIGAAVYLPFFSSAFICLLSASFLFS